jgi:hypothetical protein
LLIVVVAVESVTTVTESTEVESVVVVVVSSVALELQLAKRATTNAANINLFILKNCFVN